MSAPPLLDGWLAVCGLKREAAIWGGNAVVGGGRSDLLRERLEAAIARKRPAGLVSFGLAGGLRPGLRVGAAVIGSEIIDQGGQRWSCEAELADRLRDRIGEDIGVIVGADTVAADSRGKQALAVSAVAVDMESHLAAAAAASHALPLAVVRVVSDEVGHSVPPAAVAGMGADGDVDILAVIRGLIARPQQLPDLIRMGRNAGRAFKRLQEVRAALV